MICLWVQARESSQTVGKQIFFLMYQAQTNFLLWLKLELKFEVELIFFLQTIHEHSRISLGLAHLQPYLAIIKYLLLYVYQTLSTPRCESCVSWCRILDV